MEIIIFFFLFHQPWVQCRKEGSDLILENCFKTCKQRENCVNYMPIDETTIKAKKQQKETWYNE